MRENLLKRQVEETLRKTVRRIALSKEVISAIDDRLEPNKKARSSEK